MSVRELERQIEGINIEMQNIQVVINCGDESAYWKIYLRQQIKRAAALEELIVELIIMGHDKIREAEGA